ncbi:YopX family protein [Huintestinicola sp.]|uniref:YopX family protein n=1 Tax=Huintestinicola sp. TaxID=2981661 RepID=UPI003D7EE142
MMREILFRGKTKAITGCPYNNGKPDGEWVFGYVFSDLGAMKIRQHETDRPECNDYEVDPETVGQYTGVNDKNGTKIFEEDIVQAFTRYGTKHIYPIKYRNGTFWFGNWNWIEFLDRFQFREVIGNIFDNPELLGGENNGINR